MTGPRRDDIETTSAAGTARCPACAAGFTRVRRQRFCSPACRQAAWRARHQEPLPATAPLIPHRTRRDVTVYLCPDCDERQLGQQWCHDCQRPAIRVGIGGTCPHCEEPVTVDELLAQHEDRTTPTDKIRYNRASTEPGAVQAELEQRFADRFGTDPPGRVQVSYRGAVLVIAGAWAVWVPVVLLRWVGVLG